MAGILRTLFGLVLGLWLGSALAQSADPTRPPGAWLEGGVQGEISGEGEFRLLSVLIPQRGKAMANIGGKSVKVGEKLGEATLVRVTEREAVLQGPEGTTRLYLTPEVHQQMIVTPVVRQKDRRGQNKERP